MKPYDDMHSAIDSFQQQAQAISALVEYVDAEQAQWKPSADAWSILEVVNHLVDEEREDFRIRLDLLLHQPELDWPPIDPEGWVTARSYNSRDLATSLQQFQAERKKSVRWLAALTTPDWAQKKHHRIFPPISAGDLLASWLAHDLLHLRQLSELHYRYLEFQSKPYSPAYAGKW